MRWLLPTFKLEECQNTIVGHKLYITEFSFPTVFRLQNWHDRAILDVRLFGFGFRKVWLYENK